jgi:glycosyltransferase involved in cell wall biosynthesis
LIIGVNTRLLIKGRLEGIGYFTLQILMRMTKNHPKDTFVFFFDRQYDKNFVFSKNVIPVVVPLPCRHPLLWKVYFDFLLPLYLRKYKVEKFFSPENYIPKIKNIPIVCTIHDINFFHNNKYIGSGSHQRYFMKYFPLNASLSERIITVSEYSKKDIVENFGVSEDKVEVAYNAPNDVYIKQSEEVNRATKLEYTEGKDYFYFVGAIHKRKNLTNIFLAFDEFKRREKTDTKLVIVGAKKWWEGEIEDTYNNLEYKSDVIFVGRKEAKDVARIASASIGLVFPSLFEGFGIPIVEAWKAGTAVITSNTTSLPEVAGEGALVVNPYSVEEITSAMCNIFDNKELRQELIEKGEQQLDRFSWDKSEEKIWKIIQELGK